MSAELAQARAVLAEVATWHVAQGRACDAAVGPADGSMTRFLDRADWLYEHPVWTFESWRTDEIAAEAAGYRKPASLALVHRVRRPPIQPSIIPEDRQMEIALAALENRQPAFTRDFIGRTA